MEFVIDNTNGNLPNKVGTSFVALQQLLDKSSYLYLDQHSGPTANLLRYLMSNGDIVEITTDGKTVELNGQMLSGEEKDELFNAIKSGSLSIARKADPSKPIPVMPMPEDSAPQSPLPQPKMDMRVVKNMARAVSADKAFKEKGNSFYDPAIEQADLGDDDSTQKRFAYYLKHGVFKGEDPNA
jgi:hypothetical protein